MGGGVTDGERQAHERRRRDRGERHRPAEPVAQAEWLGRGQQ